METININYTNIENETEKAIFVDFGTRKAWMPKSQVAVNENNTITMPKWLASKNRLIETSADRRLDAMFANMKKEVEAHAKTADEKDASVRKAIYSHYDKASGEYFAIDIYGERHNA